MEILNKLKSFAQKMNEYGIPLPVLRDPASGKGSVTLTLVFISFNTALLGQIGKVTNLIGAVDLNQANYLFLMALGAYLGRRMTGSGDKKEVTIESSEEKKN